MCGTFQMVKKGDVGKRFGFSNQIDIPFSYNIRPSQPVLIVTRNSPNKGEVRTFGIKAPWDEKRLLINAQAETVAVLRSFRKLFSESRCLIAFTSYVEWEKLPDKSKQPWAFSLKTEEMFAVAGLYTDNGFVVITTKPNPLAKSVHERMPAMLLPEYEDEWLNPDTQPERLLPMIQTPYPQELMKAWRISTLINKPINNFPEVLKPL